MRCIPHGAGCLCAWRHCMDQKDNKPAILSLRLTFEERTQLERDASGSSLGAYIRARVFDPANPPPRNRGKFPVKDHRALASVLAMLGQSRLGNNLNQLARAANIGTLEVTPDTEAALKGACRGIASIRHMLMVALGLVESSTSSAESTSLKAQFSSASSGSTKAPESAFTSPSGYSSPRSRPRPPSL